MAPSYKDEPSDELTDYIDRFELFWQDYPAAGRRRCSRIDSQREWKKLAPEDRARALAALPDYRAYCAAQASWYNPCSPITYLASRRFDSFDAPVANDRAVIERGTERWLAWWPHLKQWERDYIQRHRSKRWGVPNAWPPGHEAGADPPTASAA